MDLVTLEMSLPLMSPEMVQEILSTRISWTVTMKTIVPEKETWTLGRCLTQMEMRTPRDQISKKDIIEKSMEGVDHLLLIKIVDEEKTDIDLRLQNTIEGVLNFMLGLQTQLSSDSSPKIETFITSVLKSVCLTHINLSVQSM